MEVIVQGVTRTSIGWLDDAVGNGRAKAKMESKDRSGTHLGGPLAPEQRERRRAKSARTASRAGTKARPTCRSFGCSHPKHGGKR